MFLSCSLLLVSSCPSDYKSSGSSVDKPHHHDKVADHGGVSSIICRSLLTVLLQFVRDPPGPLLYPGTCQYSACCGMRWWSIRITRPSHRCRLSLSMLCVVRCPVLSMTSTFLILYFQEMLSMLFCHLCSAASSLFVNVAVSGHTSAPYRRVDTIIALYDLVFTFRPILLFLQIFFILPNTTACKFSTEHANEKSLKIGQHLAKMWT